MGVNMNKTVSAIVCACNEAKTIGLILEVLINHPRIDEVIAVDDGSTDATWKIISSINHPKILVIKHQNNLGKGAAVASAVEKATGETILLIDADLLKLHPSHIDLLLIPFTIYSDCMTIGVRDSRHPHEKAFNILLKSFGGERALKRNVIKKLLPRIKKSGYGVEAILNLYFYSHKLRVFYIPLPGLIHRIKTEKHPFYKYSVDFIKENADIIKQYLDPENKTLETFFKQLLKKLKLD